jgi:hypothetical protein
VATNDQNLPAMAFDRFQLPDAASATPYLGVVVYITNPIDDTLGTEDAIAFDRISLLPNDFAMDAAPETFDESLRRCQYYYEMSYPIGSLEGAAVTVNGQQSVSVPLSPTLALGLYSTNELYRRSFQINFKQVKRSAPLINLYSPTSATSQLVQMQILNGNGTVSQTSNVAQSGWTEIGLTESSVTFVPNNDVVVHSGSAYGQAQQGVITYQYSANSLLGL